eukprot:scaffold256701_cov14-Tisochrysis_lutea.AAC.1
MRVCCAVLRWKHSGHLHVFPDIYTNAAALRLYAEVELNDTALESTQVPQHLIDPPMLPFLDPRVEHALLLTGLGAGAFLEWYRDPSRLFSPSLTPRSW